MNRLAGFGSLVVVMILISGGITPLTADELKPSELYLPKSVDELLNQHPARTTRELKAARTLSDSIAAIRSHQRSLRRELIALEQRIRSVHQQLRITDQILEKVVRDLEKEEVIREKRSREEMIEAPEDRPESSEFSGGLDPNKASLDELRGISGVDENLAKRIDWFRSNVEAFSEPSDLLRVPGVTEELFKQMKEHFRPGPYDTGG